MVKTNMRIDFHVHSKFSKRPSQWILQKIKCPESFTEPMDIYRIAKDKGMTWVTITDHNSIDGALEIAHLPDTFIGEEITSYFPEDGCKLHVLALNITESQHEDIQKIRANVYELVEYLNQSKIFHALAHPFYPVNDRLTSAHFEKMLLLFKVFEINGSQDEKSNQCLEQIISNLTTECVDRLANLHNLAPRGFNPWIKNFIGGSDDHSSLTISRTHTKIASADSLVSALFAILNGQAKVVRVASTPLTFARTIYSIAYQFYRKRFNLEQYVKKDLLMTFLNRSLGAKLEKKEEFGLMSKIYYFCSARKRFKMKTEAPESLALLLHCETGKLLRDNPALMNYSAQDDYESAAAEKNWFNFVNQVSNRVLFNFANHLVGHLSGANVFNIFHTIGSAGGFYALLTPYFISFTHFARDGKFGQKQTERFKLAPVGSQNGKTAHFVDKFVNTWKIGDIMDKQLRCLPQQNSFHQVITCGADQEKNCSVIHDFEPIGIYGDTDFPSQKIYFPPFLEILNYCSDQHFAHVHAATPGPMGLTALAIARILKLPISGSYRSDLPRCVQFLTGEESLEELKWKYLLWYYDQMETIHVPNDATGQELIQKGIHSDKILQFPAGFPIERFHPDKRNQCLESRYGIQEKTKLLFVGPVSIENNLHLLAKTFKTLLQFTRDIHLVVAGDGPYLDEMKKALVGTPATFTGPMTGESLASIYASSDIFISPGALNGVNRKIFQAQASGIPVIVANQNGSSKKKFFEKTCLVVDPDDPASIFDAIQGLIRNPTNARRLGQAGRRQWETFAFVSELGKLWSDPLAFPPEQPSAYVAAGTSG